MSASPYRCGCFGVVRVKETLGAAFAPAHLLPGLPAGAIDEHAAWLAPNHYDVAKGRLVMGTHSWIVRTGRHNVLVDTCIGNHKPRPVSPGFDRLELPYLERLAQAGLAPGDIDFVLCTHLHVDHVGWNTRLQDGRWVPTFPNARVLCSQSELASAEAKANGRGDAEDREVWNDSVLPVLEAGALQALRGTHVLEEGRDGVLRVEPTPGHTPGHVALSAESQGERMYFAGDICHHPLQVYHPDVNSRFCEDADAARAMRRQVLSQCAESGALFAPAHWGPPHAGRIRAAGAAFRIDFGS